VTGRTQRQNLEAAVVANEDVIRPIHRAYSDKASITRSRQRRGRRSAASGGKLLSPAGGVDPESWQTLGAKPEALRMSQDSDSAAAGHGIRMLKTCTPYLAGNVPVKGEHCAWMESSAVVYCNSVLGARTNTEGRESTSSGAHRPVRPSRPRAPQAFRSGSGFFGQGILGMVRGLSHDPADRSRT
jgi:hypothetical protein